MKKNSWIFQAIFAIVFALCTAGMEFALPFMYADWIRFLLLGLISLCMFGAAETGILAGLIVALSGPTAGYFMENYSMNFAIIFGVANCLLVLCYWAFRKKRLLGVLTGSIARFAFIYLVIEQVISRIDGPEGDLASTVVGYWDWTYLLVPLAAGVIYFVITGLMSGSLFKKKEKVKKDEKDNESVIDPEECDAVTSVESDATELLSANEKQ